MRLAASGVSEYRLLYPDTRSEASHWSVESEDEGLVTTERPVEGSLVIVSVRKRDRYRKRGPRRTERESLT